MVKLLVPEQACESLPLHIPLIIACYILLNFRVKFLALVFLFSKISSKS